jgi:predicted nucleic acid-binding protein
MRILFDTDVIMDYIQKREPFSEEAERAICFCVENKIQSCIAAHTIPNIHYILRKHLTKEQRKTTLLRICRMFYIVGIDGDKLVSALENDDFDDYEDCLQAECAKDFGADYIITRNTKDYSGSAVPAIEPPEFLKLVEQR